VYLCFFIEYQTTLSSIIPQKPLQNGCKKAFSRQITKDVKLQCLVHIKPDRYQGPKLENNKSMMADGRHLGNIQAGVSRPVLD